MFTEFPASLIGRRVKDTCNFFCNHGRIETCILKKLPIALQAQGYIYIYIYNINILVSFAQLKKKEKMKST